MLGFRFRWIVIVGTAVPFGCSTSEEATVARLVADSAGIEVVSHSEIPVIVEVQEESALRLGSGRIEVEFYRVRGGVLLRNGSVALANAGSGEILLFDNGGEPIRRFGGEGQGPEEFSNLFWIQGMADGGFAASDPGNGRLVWLSEEGQLVSSRTIDFEVETAHLDKAIVGRGYTLGTTPAREVLAVPWARATYKGQEGPLPLLGELRRYTPDLDSHVVIDSVVLRTWYEEVQPEGPPIAQVFGSPLLVFAANQDWMAYSDGTTHRTTVLKDGKPDYVIQELRPRLVSRTDSVPTGFHSAADSLPAYTEIAVDSEGRVWLRPGTPTTAVVAEWRMFADRGRRAARIPLPVTTTVLDALDDRILLLERDELDVESVVIVRIAEEELEGVR